MRYVDHDPAAARAAAARCHAVAGDLLANAGWLESAPATVAWWGCERDDVVRAGRELAGELRREARSLQATADLLEASARAAERAEADIAAEVAAAARAEAAAACAVGPTVGPAVTPGRRPARRRTVSMPAGVR